MVDSVFLEDMNPDLPRPVSDALGVLATRLGLARSDAIATLEKHWVQLIGEDLARTCRLVSLREGVMRVEVDDPAIADHLRWMSGDLISAANQLCGGSVVERVGFVVRRPTI